MLFLLKLLLVPALIALVTLAGRRWGPLVAGWLSAFPIVAGPILLVLALEQGAAFAAVAAADTLMAVLAILVFSVAYARNARRGMPRAMLAALLAYGLTVVVLQAVSLPLGAGFVAVLAGLSVAPLLFGPAPQEEPVTGKPANDLPWRMLAGAVLAMSVTYAAASLGPRLSGLFAMFPVMSTVLVGFSHRASGAGFAVALLRGMIKGYVAFAVFCVTLSLLLRQQSIGMAFLLATGAALVVQLAMKWWMGAAQRASRANAA
ncbi:hypothetical protein LQ564_06215 [Massilia sp. G4R7]|uniref:Uncharacterized protein n=1 Tax=Massilia phyllostachyos TaxID=2898585 RepID=A0ABS8Q2F5_9BURK|nr:hypothetical protein [Massilia phyllostachyos]MCD2515910.1 hypothetical protein [Massilia phyllostachyos]